MSEPFASCTVGGGAARAVVAPTHAERLCEGHFPGDPLVPGALLAGLMADVGTRLLAAEHAVPPVLAEIVQCAFLAPVRPSDPIVVEARGAALEVEAEVLAGGTRAAHAILRFRDAA